MSHICRGIYRKISSLVRQRTIQYFIPHTHYETYNSFGHRPQQYGSRTHFLDVEISRGQHQADAGIGQCRTPVAFSEHGGQREQHSHKGVENK